jgi:DNA polymerase sigma
LGNLECCKKFHNTRINKFFLNKQRQLNATDSGLSSYTNYDLLLSSIFNMRLEQLLQNKYY